MLGFLKEVFQHFNQANTFNKGAALAYYAVFSLLPMIMIIIASVGFFWGKDAVAGDIYHQLSGFLGHDAAMQIEDMVQSHHLNHGSALTSLIGFFTLALSASGMFNQIHTSFNGIWNIKAKPKSSLLKYFSKHFASLLVLILVFLIILVSTTVNAFLVKHGPNMTVDHQFWVLFEHLISFIVLSLAFIVMFNFLGDAKVHWQPGLISSFVTAALFMVGKVGIGLYIGKSHVSTTFGAASALALLMIWVYYISQIIFLGASFLLVLSKKMGLDIQPKKDAVLIEQKELIEK